MTEMTLEDKKQWARKFIIEKDTERISELKMELFGLLSKPNELRSLLCEIITKTKRAAHHKNS